MIGADNRIDPMLSALFFVVCSFCGCGRLFSANLKGAQSTLSPMPAKNVSHSARQDLLANSGQGMNHIGWPTRTRTLRKEPVGCYGTLLLHPLCRRHPSCSVVVRLLVSLSRSLFLWRYFPLRFSLHVYRPVSFYSLLSLSVSSPFSWVSRFIPVG